MHPELFKIPFFDYSIHTYGLMMVLGLVAAMELAKFMARRSGLNPDLFSSAAILGLVSGLIGARIAFVLQNFSEFTTGSFGENLFNAINLTSGGLVYYGGFIFAFATLVAWAIYKHIPLLRGMDIIAPCLMVGLAFGRVGCFLNGCCWGQHCEASSPLAVTFPYHSPAYLDDFAEKRIEPDPRLLERDPIAHRERLADPKSVAKQPELISIAARARSLSVINTQLISTATATLIALITLCVFTLYLAPGRGFAVMMMLEGISRFLIEGLRVEPPVLGPLTLSMVIGLGVFVGGIVLWFVAGALRNKNRIGATPGYPSEVAERRVQSA